MSSKIAVVTGASRGLGRSAALALVHAGVDIIGTYNRDHERAEKMAAEVAERGARAATLQLDLRESDPYGSFAERVRRLLGDEFRREGVDYLVNNAGVGIFAPFEETTTAQFDAIVQINLRGP